MQCPNCQKDLVEIPTLEGPQLDVCPDKHGLWIDVGEVNLFVENYRALDEASQHAAAPADSTCSSRCPRCGGRLDPKSVLEAALFACRACRGWWLPQGSLTQLNATARGGAAPIRFDETDFYTQAQKRRATSRPMKSTVDSGRSRTEPRAQEVWFWAIFLGGALVLACLILVAGIRKAVVPAHWATAPDVTLLFLALGVVGGMVLSIYGFVVNNRKQLMESIPTSPVRSLAVGLVEVSGHARPERELLRAPFSGMPCVLFSYTVEERRESGKNAKWETIAKGTSPEPFFVQDNTGKVLVVPFDAQLILPDNRTSRNNWLGSLPEETILGLLKLGISVDGWLGEKTIRCTEACILPDETVYVMGTAQENRGAAESTENSARLYIGSSRDNEFIISDRSEKELLSRLRWQVFAFLAGGPALALLCLLHIYKTYGTVVR
jgi:Zn-finger nucleic acid-binding protein